MSRTKFRLWNCLRLARIALSAGIKTCMVLIVQIYISILPFTREQQIVFLLCACYYKNKKTAPSGTAFNVYKFIAITPVRWEQSLFFSEPLKLRERQSMREPRLLYPL